MKKLGETALNTASTIGAKSTDLMEMGKTKLVKTQLEGKIKDSKTEVGHLVYEAYKSGVDPDSAALKNKLNEIQDMENQIKGIEEKLDQDKVKEGPQMASRPPPFNSAPPQQASVPPPFASAPPQDSVSPTAAKFCSKCGTALGGDAKFCISCGNQM